MENTDQNNVDEMESSMENENQTNEHIPTDESPVDESTKDELPVVKPTPEVKKTKSGVELKWYVLRAVSGKEKKVKEHIDYQVKANGIQDFVQEVLIPMEKVYQIRNGKKISKEKNFFPGYILVHAALVGEVPHVLRAVNNVIGFLGAKKGGDPMPLRKAEVNRILGKVDELAETDEAINIPYIVGETVKVVDGPFNGFNGLIEEINEEKKKLKVMVKIFGRKTPLELGYMQVEKEN